MKKTLLMTTALVALSVSGNAYTQDINITEDIDIIQTGVKVDENDKIIDSGSFSNNITQTQDGNLNISAGTITVKTMSAAINHMANGDINIENSAIVNGEGIEAQQGDNGEVVSVLGNTIVHNGNGDINIKGGKINLNNAGIFKTPQCSGGGYGDMCVGEPQEAAGNINFSGGEHNFDNSENYSVNNINITGGTLNLKNDSGFFAENINISGGNISLTDSEIDSEENMSISGEKTVLNLTDSDIEANGDINISGGKINVSGSSAEISSAGNINIFNGAEINIASGSTLYAKVSAEDMDQAQKATLWVADSDTRFNIAGTLSANINGDDCGKIHLQNSNAKIDGNVKGASLIFEDSHTLSKAVTGTVGGLDIFEIQKGTMVYDKEIDGGASSVVVGEGATLDIGANELHSGGEKEVAGEGVHFKDNSTLKFTVTDKDIYGKIYANYVNISKNGTTLDMSLNSAALSAGDDPLTLKLFNDEDTPVEIEGKFANLTSNSRYDFADNGDGTYTVTANGTTASDVVVDAGGSANNASTAEAWDSVSASDSSPTAAAVTEKLAQLSNSTDSASQKAYVDALTAVAPEVAPMVQKTQTETANQVFSAVSTRLTGGSISTGSQGMSSGDSNPDAAVWVQGMYNHSELDDTSKAKGFDADSAGVAMGIEKNIGRAGKVGAGYAYTNTDIDGFMRSTDVDTHTAILYGEYKPSNWYINGIATYGWSDYSEDKSVAGVGVKADYDVETLGLQAMTGYDMQFKNFGLTPEAGLRYVHIKQDAYTDSADQHVSGNDSDILTGVIGAKVNKTFVLGNGMLIKPEARIAATYDLFNDDVNSVVTLANGSAYAVDGEALDRFGMEFGAGVTAEVNDNIEFSLGYEGKFREDYTDHTGLINAKYKF